MSRKHIINSFPVIESGNMTSSVISETTNVEQMDHIRYNPSWSGNPTGGFFVEVSDNGTTFEILDFGTPIEAEGFSGAHTITITMVNFKFIRLIYLPLSGTGTLNANIKAHGRGA